MRLCILCSGPVVETWVGARRTAWRIEDDERERWPRSRRGVTVWAALVQGRRSRSSMRERESDFVEMGRESADGHVNWREGAKAHQGSRADSAGWQCRATAYRNIPVTVGSGILLAVGWNLAAVEVLRLSMTETSPEGNGARTGFSLKRRPVTLKGWQRQLTRDGHISTRTPKCGLFTSRDCIAY